MSFLAQNLKTLGRALTDAGVSTLTISYSGESVGIDYVRLSLRGPETAAAALAQLKLDYQDDETQMLLCLDFQAMAKKAMSMAIFEAGYTEWNEGGGGQGNFVVKANGTAVLTHKSNINAEDMWLSMKPD